MKLSMVRSASSSARTALTRSAPRAPGATVSPSRRLTVTSASGKPTASSTTSATSTPHTTPVSRATTRRRPVDRPEWSPRWSRRDRNEGLHRARYRQGAPPRVRRGPPRMKDASSSRFTRPPSRPRSPRSLRRRRAGSAAAPTRDRCSESRYVDGSLDSLRAAAPRTRGAVTPCAGSSPRAWRDRTIRAPLDGVARATRERARAPLGL